MLRKTRFLLIVILLLIAGVCGIRISNVMAATTITVNSLADDQSNDGECTLREAIISANTNVVSGALAGECAAGDGAGDTIEFDIAGAGPHTIQPGSGLPAITQSVIIDGFSETGATPNTTVSPAPFDAELMIEIDGTNIALGAAPCFRVTNANGVTFKGLVINNCGQDGIRLSRATNTTIQGNFIGVDTDGVTSQPNGRNEPAVAAGVGIFIEYSTTTQIGGTAAADRNIISSNQFGEIFVSAETSETDFSSYMTVQGNYLGLGGDGTTALPGGYEIGHGNAMLITHSQNDIIGGSAVGAGNVIATSREYGISFRDGSANSVVEGNYIGTDYTGNATLSHISGSGHAGAGISVATITNGGYTRGSNNITIRNNVLSGNENGENNFYDAQGILISDGAYEVTVVGNKIGVGANGSTDVGNQGSGILIQGELTHDNIIGGDTSLERNIISANDAEGVRIYDAYDNIVSGNYIGVASNGTTALGNQLSSVLVGGDAYSNIIGGDSSAEANIIANSVTDNGVIIEDATNDIAVIGNSIFDNSVIPPIDLNNDGISANDAGDPDTGPNDMLNKPLWTSVTSGGGNTTIDYLLDVPAGNYRVEFFSETGKNFLGSDNITSSGTGAQSFSDDVAGTGYTGVRLSATEIDGDLLSGFGATSELGGPDATAVATVVVTSSADDQSDDGECTLREAIIATNTNTASGVSDGECSEGAGTDTIEFDITPNEGAGPHTIQPTSELPAITEAVTINGYSETGASPNTNPMNAAFNGTLMIEIDMQNAPADADGLQVEATSTIRGLAINGTTGTGDGIEVVSGSDSVIAGNFIGLNTAGDTGVGNNQHGIFITSGASNVTIGGTDAADRNIISGNTDNGALVNSDSNTIQGNFFGLDYTGLNNIDSCDGPTLSNLKIVGDDNTVGGNILAERNVFSACAGSFVASSVSVYGGFGTPSSGNVIQGNYIGTDINGEVIGTSEAIGMAFFGDAIDNLLGGTNSGEGNLIRGNGTGVGLIGVVPLNGANNTLIGNSIYENDGGSFSSLGIDIFETQDFGGSFVNTNITANDAGDGDTGENEYINFPVISSINSSDGIANITYSLDINDSETGATGYRVEFFANVAGDDSGNGEGQTYLGFDTISGDVTDRTASITLPAGVSGNKYITATATMTDASSDGFGHTSEFSAYLLGLLVAAVPDEADGSSGGGISGVLADTGSNQAKLILIAAALLAFAVIIYRKKSLKV